MGLARNRLPLGTYFYRALGTVFQILRWPQTRPQGSGWAQNKPNWPPNSQGARIRAQNSPPPKRQTMKI